MKTITGRSASRSILFHGTNTSAMNIGIKISDVAMNPSTPIQSIEYLLSEVDAVLVMLVEPGFGGQKMITSMIRKIEQLLLLKEHLGYDFVIACDGGIKIENAEQLITKGANELIVGTGLFNSPRFPRVVSEFLDLLRKHYSELSNPP